MEHKHTLRLTAIARTSNDATSQRVFEVVWLVSVIALSLMFAVYSAPSIQITNPRCGITALLDGSAYRPYVYRMLTTWLLQAATALGMSLTDGVFVIVSAAVGSSVVAFRYLIASFEGYRTRSALIAPLLFVGIAALQISFPYTMIYDMPTLALFIVCYALMIQRRWAWYIVVFVVACLCKETSAFLVIGFAAMYLRRMRWRHYVILGTTQFMIWCVVRGALMWALRNAPGAEMETYWVQHLIAIQRLPWAIALYGALVTGLLVAIARQWSRKPLALRLPLVSLAPIIGVLYVVGGTPFELRVFYEIVPLVVILCFTPARDAHASKRSIQENDDAH